MVFGRHIAAAIPLPEAVTAAHELDRARDTDATVAELVVELEDRGFSKHQGCE